MEAGQSYGQSLPDQVERISALFDSHLEAVGDVRDIYKEHVALDREYAAKLQALAKRAADRKAKMEVNLVVGADPTKIWDAHSLKQNTLNAAYDAIITSISATAQDHLNVSDSLNQQVVEVLKNVEKKNEDSKKKEIQFFQKLVADRDRTNTDRQKNKAKYDEECGEVENQRQKQNRSHDDRHAERIHRQAEQQRNDMLNSKNTYIISTTIANTMKAKFYEHDLPELENVFQAMQTRLVERFSNVLAHAQALQLSHLDVLKSRLNTVEAAVNAVNPAQDQTIFIDYNIRPFTAPPDYQFEPCQNFYDTDQISIEPAPKVFLQNKLIKSQSKLQELRPVLASKQRDLEQLEKLVTAYDADKSLGKIEEVSESYAEARQQLTYFLTSECILKAEIGTILSVLGDDVGGERPHSFKSSSFSIPTTCGYCQTSVWGLSKQGKTCKLCGLSVHSKCELKVPADCAKGRHGHHRVPPSSSGGVSRTASSASRLNTSASSGSTTPSASSFVSSVQEDDESAESAGAAGDAGGYPTAKVLFDFKATSEFELAVTEGILVNVLEPDDGSGWVKVANDRGQDGLVPASYLEVQEEAPAYSASPATPVQTSGGSGKYVRAIYAYAAQGSDELSLADGETIELTSGSNGGMAYGDGWWEGVNAQGQRGIFPSNYVQTA